VQKRTDHAEAQVQEYWIVNPQSETITVLRLANGAYCGSGAFPARRIGGIGPGGRPGD